VYSGAQESGEVRAVSSGVPYLYLPLRFTSRHVVVAILFHGASSLALERTPPRSSAFGGTLAIVF
jgi:hypothetical protein